MTCRNVTALIRRPTTAWTRWQNDGTWDRVLDALRLKADEAGLLDYSQWNADSTSIRATRAAGGAVLKKGRKP